MRSIAKHYIEKIVPSDKFLINGVCDIPDLLYKPFRDIISAMFKEYKEKNTDNDVPYAYETFRSHARQSYYYSIGSSPIRGGNILNAGMHHFGIAVDIVNLDDKNNNNIKDGKERVDWTNINYSLFRKLSQKYEVNFLSWEECHFQMIGVNQQGQLRREVYDYVKQWQRASGLLADGIVGPKTIAKTKSLYL